MPLTSLRTVGIVHFLQCKIMWFLPRDMNTALTEDTPVFENVPDLRIWRKISQLGISFAGVDSLPYPVFLLWQSIYYTDN